MKQLESLSPRIGSLSNQVKIPVLRVDRDVWITRLLLDDVQQEHLQFVPLEAEVVTDGSDECICESFDLSFRFVPQSADILLFGIRQYSSVSCSIFDFVPASISEDKQELPGERGETT